MERDEFDVTLIEGRDRIGGRVHQVKLPGSGHVVDCGPNWIHGTEDNPILDIANAAKIPLSRWDENTYIYDEDGGLLAQSDSDIYSTMMWDIVQDAFAYSSKNSPDISVETSLWDFFCEQVKKRIPDTKPDFERKRNFILQMAEMWGAFVGSPVYTQSLKFFWLEECIEGGMYLFTSVSKSCNRKLASDFVFANSDCILILDRKFVLRWHLHKNSANHCQAGSGQGENYILNGGLKGENH